MRQTLTLAFAAGLAAMAGAGPASADDDAMSRSTLGGVRAIERLPIAGMSAVEAENVDGIVFMSANGRFVFKGKAYDLWNGAELNTLEDVRKAANTITRLPANMSELGPLSYGSGPERVTVFVDPLCPACLQAMSQMPELTEDYTFDLMVVPVLGERSQKLTRALSCATEPAKATEALRREDYSETLAQDPDCDLLPIQKRLVTAQLMGIRGVPFIIAPDGRVKQGAPNSLRDWLVGGE